MMEEKALLFWRLWKPLHLLDLPVLGLEMVFAELSLLLRSDSVSRKSSLCLPGRKNKAACTVIHRHRRRARMTQLKFQEFLIREKNLLLGVLESRVLYGRLKHYLLPSSEC